MKARLRLKIIFNVLFVDLLQMNWRKVQEHTILSPNALTCVLMTQIQRLLLLKADGRIIGNASRDLAAAEAWYHGQCYRDYTRPDKASKNLDSVNLAQMKTSNVK